MIGERGGSGRWGAIRSLSQDLLIQFLLCLDDVMKRPPGLFISLKTLVPHSIPSPAIISIEATMNSNLT